MHRHIAIVTIGAATLLLACERTRGNGGPELPSCTRAIDYQARKIEVGATSIPISVAGKGAEIKIGTVDVTPQRMQEASELVQRLDMMQFQTCQNLMVLPPEDRAAYVNKRDALIAGFQVVVGAMSKAANDTQFNLAIQAGNRFLEPFSMSQSTAALPLGEYHLEKLRGEGQTIPMGKYAEFSVRVVDAKGKPVTSAKVLWQTPFGGDKAYVSATDEQGITSATNLYTFGMPGEYIQTATLVAPTSTIGFVSAASIPAAGAAVTFKFQQ